MWEEVMYDVVKVVDLVRHFSASCQRHGLCDENTFPQNFIGIIKELEQCVRLLPFGSNRHLYLAFYFCSFGTSEFVRVAEVLSQCRGKTKFEQFKRGLARNDMVREIQRCDRHMNRIFERFMVSDLAVWDSRKLIRICIFTSDCHGGGYSISTAVCGEGTVNVCLGTSECAYAHAHAHAYTFARARANVNARPHANIHAHAPRLYRGAANNASLPLIVSPTPTGRAFNAAQLACPTSVGRL
jgi:hypothetical protein